MSGTKRSSGGFCQAGWRCGGRGSRPVGSARESGASVCRHAERASLRARVAEFGATDSSTCKRERAGRDAVAKGNTVMIP